MRVLSWSSPVWLSLGLVLSSASGCLVVKFDGTDSLTEVSLSDVLTDGFTQTSSPTDTLPTEPTEPTETLTDPTDSTATDPTDTPPVCGDGSVDVGEDCDDGNLNDQDGCVAGCQLASCGDGHRRLGVEACDDGNNVGGDGCEADCTLASCGNGELEGGEGCDDGNQDNGDGCLNTCALASCGDGFVELGVEACDDGDASNTNACVAGCALASCGDGFVQEGVEQCDDGNAVPADGCDNCIAGDLPPECQGVKVLQEASRNVTSTGEVECDQDLPADGEWSRFSGAAGTTMPLSAPAVFACGTHAPGWLNGVIPAPADGIVARDVCFHWDGNTCNWKVPISVRNCGAFVMFKLKPVPSCALRYCGSAG
jgi:cysteine-rich repeat protein